MANHRRAAICGRAAADSEQGWQSSSDIISTDQSVGGGVAGWRTGNPVVVLSSRAAAAAEPAVAATATGTPVNCLKTLTHVTETHHKRLRALPERAPTVLAPLGCIQYTLLPLPRPQTKPTMHQTLKQAIK